MSESEAKCGSCNGYAVHTRLRRSGRREFYVTSCAECGVTGPRASDREASISGWNRLWNRPLQVGPRLRLSKEPPESAGLWFMKFDSGDGYLLETATRVEQRYLKEFRRRAAGEGWTFALIPEPVDESEATSDE